MGLFSRKGKANKEASKAEEHKKLADQAQPTKKFVPRHGSAKIAHQDAPDGHRSNDDRMTVTEHRRIEIPRQHGAFQRAAYARGSMTAPASPSGQGPRRTDGQSDDGYFTPPESIPMPPAFKERPSVYRPKYQHRSSSDHFVAAPAPRKLSMTGGYYIPHAASDSGYESAEPISAAHSRVPSEQNLLDYTPSFLPLTQDMREIKLYGGEHAADAEGSPTQKSAGNVSPLDLNSDDRSIRSNKSAGKRTRFEDDVEPMPPLQVLEQFKNSSESISRPSPPWLPNHDSGSSTPERPQAVRLDHPRMHRLQSSWPSAPHTALVEASRDLQQTRHTRVGSIPPLSILDGFKVNKKGKILDEEGDAIGELVDGDLLDCVRQKANANGEVIDEYGRVVGRVRICCAPAHTAVHVEAPQHIKITSPVPAIQEPSAVVERDVSPSEHQPAAPLPGSEVLPAPRCADEQPHAEEAAHDTPLAKPVGDVPAEHLEEQKALYLPMQAATLAQESKRMPRSASEKSLSELSKTYARPPMSSVPENNVPDDDITAASPSLFAYKGGIPKMEGPPSIRRRSNSPPQALPMPAAIAPGQLPNPAHYAKMALVGGFPNNTLHPPVRPTGANSRRTTTHFAGSGAGSSRPPLPSALKKTTSHTYSFETGPPGSDSSSDDGPTRILHARR
ncbi:hypothetical protein BST61_g7814 [Cercospora zeina]